MERRDEGLPGVWPCREWSGLFKGEGESLLQRVFTNYCARPYCVEIRLEVLI